MNRQSTAGKTATAKTSKKAPGTRKTSRKSAVPAVAGRKDITRTTASAARRAVPAPDPQTRHEMIAQAAYFHAERRGFADGGELGDWLEAESEIERALAG